MNAPRLRFKDFSEDWTPTNLEALTSNITAGKSKYRQGENRLYPVLGSTGVIGYSDMYDYDGNFILIARVGANAGKITTFNGRCKITDNTIFFESTKAETGFLVELLKKHDLSKKSFGSGQPLVKASEVKTLSILVPSLKEQHKIGDFFRKINLKIKLQQERIQLLKEQKKAFLQKIFSQELRFKDENGRNYQEWKEQKLKDLGSTFTGLSGKTKEDFGYGDHSFITYTNVFNNVFATTNGLEKVNVLANENQALVQKGDILLTTSSETPQEVGMASIWNHSMENIHLNSFCFGYRLNPTQDIIPEFIAISLRSDYMRNKIILLAQGSTRFNMSKTELMLQTIKVPCLEEQQKIVNFYKTLDQKVSLAEQQLEHLETQKQAFKQQMYI